MTTSISTMPDWIVRKATAVPAFMMPAPAMPDWMKPAAPAAPAVPTNSQFMAQVLRTGETGWTVTFAESPRDPVQFQRAGRATYAGDESVNSFGHQNSFYSVATFKAGAAKRITENFERLAVLVADDMSPADLSGPVSYILRTSENKHQIGVFLSEDDPDCKDIGLVRALLKMMVETKKMDANGNSPVRWVRLPVGINTKYSPAPQLKTVKWCPDYRVPLAQACKSFGVDLDECRSKAAEAIQTAANRASVGHCTDDDWEDGKSAMNAIDPNCEHGKWRTVGTAAKSTGRVEAFGEFEAWSAKATRPGAYLGTAHNLNQWKSFDTSKISLGSLFHLAQENGWKRPPRDVTGMFPAAPVTADAGHPLTRYRQLGDTIKPTEFVLPHLIPMGLTVLGGAPGAGKTTNGVPLFAAAAWCCADDHPARPPRPRRVVLISEDPAQVEQVLQAMIMQGLCTRERVNEWVKVVEARRMPAAAIVEARDAWRELAVTHMNSKDEPVTLMPLIVLDTTSSCLEVTSENDNAEISKSIATLKQGLHEFPIVVVAHTAKTLKGRTSAAELSSRGAGAFEGDSNKTLFMIVEDDGSRFLLHGKTRFEIPAGKEEIRFEQLTRTMLVDGDFDTQAVTLRCSKAVFARASDRAVGKAGAAASKREAEARANQERIQAEMLTLLNEAFDEGRGINAAQLKKAISGGNDIKQAALKALEKSGRVATWYARGHESFYTHGGIRKGNALLIATTPAEHATWLTNGQNMPAAIQDREDEGIDSS